MKLCLQISSIHFILALLGGLANATVILKLELPQLVGRADVVFVGQVAKVQSRWNEHKRIVTDTTFTVEQMIKGKATQAQIVVRNLGGTVDGLGMWVSGSPTFKVGERAVIFSDQREKHRYVTGMQQGVFRITLDPATKLPRVIARTSGLALARRAGSSLKLIEAQTARPRPLEEFIGEIKQLISICAEDSSRCHDQ